MDTKVFAEHYVEAQNKAWQEGDFIQLVELEHPDIIYHIPAFGDLVGFEAHMSNIDSVRKAASEIHQEWNYVAGDGEVFVMSYKSHAKITDEIPEMGLKPGDTSLNDNFQVYRLEGQKIAEVWFHSNSTVA